MLVEKPNEHDRFALLHLRPSISRVEGSLRWGAWLLTMMGLITSQLPELIRYLLILLTITTGMMVRRRWQWNRYQITVDNRHWAFCDTRDGKVTRWLVVGDVFVSRWLLAVSLRNIEGEERRFWLFFDALPAEQFTRLKVILRFVK